MAKITKGIILAGGAGSRLFPLSVITTKQLLPIYDKPMVYYPLAMLLENGLSRICLISTEDQQPLFRRLLGDGAKFGVALDYRVQAEPKGIAEAFLIAEDFIAGDSVALALGDNIFHPISSLAPAFASFASGGTIFSCPVHNPARYGVVERAANGDVISIEEKPVRPRSQHVVPGLYLFDGHAVEMAKKLRPSLRGELEITDLIRLYLEQKQLTVLPLPRGFAWLDAGTSSSLHEASSFVQALEKRQGVKIGCPEEAALRSGLIGVAHFRSLVAAMPACEYRDCLERIASGLSPGELS